MKPARPIRVALSALGLGLAACIYDTAPAHQSLCDVRPCYALYLFQRMNGPIKGDTVRVYVVSDSGFDRGVTWTVAGSAELVPGGELRKSDPGLGNQMSSVLVRGLSAGGATVTATRTDPYRTAAYDLTVLDSSAITRLTLFGTVPDKSTAYAPLLSNTMRVGDRLLIMSAATDYLGRAYPVNPDRWAVSDTAIATVEGCGMVTGRRAGTVYVIAGFAMRTDSVRITVTP